jgi:hypothetical protein
LTKEPDVTMKTIPWLLMLLLALAGCKKEEQVPEHIRQQRLKEKRLEQRRQELKRKTEKAAKAHDAGVDRYRMWPPAVRQAFYALYRSRSEGVPQKARALAQLGFPAADAMRAIAGGAPHSAKKKALVSFMLVDMNMFRVHELTKMAREYRLPFVQRAAIEALARIGNPDTEAALDQLVKDLPKMPLPKMPESHLGHHHGPRPGPATAIKPGQGGQVLNVPPERHPMVRWTKRVRRRLKGKRWSYSAEQLAELDHIFHASSPQELKQAINAVQGTSLEQGLRAILRTPVSRPSVQAGAAYKLVEPHIKDSKALRALCSPEEHQLVRLQAARALLELGRARDRAFVTRLAQQDQDPLAPMLQRMLNQASGK